MTNPVRRHDYFSRIFWSFLAIVGLCTLEFTLLTFLEAEWLKIVILGICTALKIGFIAQFIRSTIFKNVVAGVPYHVYLLYIFIAILVFILSFASDFLCVYSIDNQSFTGLDSDLNLAKAFFSFLFLSTMFFTMQGAMDVIPAGTLAETYILLESIVAYTSFIFFLSNFSSLKHSLRVLRKK